MILMKITLWVAVVVVVVQDRWMGGIANQTPFWQLVICSFFPPLIGYMIWFKQELEQIRKSKIEKNDITRISRFSFKLRNMYSLNLRTHFQFPTHINNNDWGFCDSQTKSYPACLSIVCFSYFPTYMTELCWWAKLIFATKGRCFCTWNFHVVPLLQP